MALLAASSLLIHGYRLGQEDGAIYLPAIKKILNPQLYPYDSAFFLSQTRWMLFDEMVAASAHITRLPLDWIVFLWHVFTVFLVLLACRKFSRRCFSRSATQWAAVLTVWAALSLPVTWTGLSLVENGLHPRNFAFAAVLFAFVALLDGRLHALVWLAIAATAHPTMAFFGAFHLLFQVVGLRKLRQPNVAGLPILPFSSLAAVLWIGLPPNEAWQQVLASRPYLFPLRWPWYAWLGVIAPLVLLRVFAFLARKNTEDAGGIHAVSEHICRRAAIAGLIGVAVAIVTSIVPALEPLIPVEPMRTLHFVYFLLVFFAGGLTGEYILDRRLLRWLLFLAPICFVFWLAGWLTFPGQPHIEWPGHAPRNAWIEAFDWVRQNTPRSALFALDPRYMYRPGEGVRGFRAFAERSMLADWVKDRAVTQLEPGLAYQWRQEVRDRQRWQNFSTDDFRRLREYYGVGWVVLERSAKVDLPCPYANEAVMVCKVE